LRLAGVSGQERIAVTKKVSELELEILKKQLQQKNALTAEAITAYEKSVEDNIKRDEMQSQREYELGNITKTQLLALQKQYEERRFEIQRESQEARINALLGDPNMDPVALQKLFDQMAELQRRHALNVAKIQTDMAVENKARWEQFLSPISSAFSKSITGIIQGTQTWRKAMSNIFSSVLGEFVNLGVQMATKWAAMELAKTMATQKNSTLRLVLEKMGLLEATAAETTASGTTVATKTAEAAAVLPVTAAEAAGEGAKAVAGIPIVGPALAAGAFAAIMSMVMGGLKSARGGFDIPAGLNPVTQLHQREMVLPEQYADVIRGLAGGGGGGDSAGGLHINLFTPDVASTRRFLLNNKHLVAEALKSAGRDFSNQLRR
jgi:hypothetical protein